MKFNIKEICEQKSVTQKQLAEMIGMSEAGLSNAIKGNPKAETLERIANALGVEIASLFCNEKKRTVICKGEMELGENKIPCYVLDDGMRVLSGRGMQEALHIVDTENAQRQSGARLTRYLEQKTLNPFFSKYLDAGHFTPIVCYDGSTKIHGYNAEALADICDVFLEARKHIQLSPRQRIIAEQCEMLMRCFARVGIIALVDEATGYQYDRERNELQRILKAYISEELLAWEKRFPDEFYKEIFRLNNWGYLSVNGINKRPSIIGKWTRRYIYEALPSGVLKALLNKTERDDNGRLIFRLHQHLTRDQGIEHLNRQIVSVVTLMNVSDSWAEFDRLWNRKFGQLEFQFQEQDDLISPR